MFSESAYGSLADAFARHSGSGRTISFVSGSGQIFSQTFGGLLDRAYRTLGSLQAQGLGPRDEVILVLEDNETFVSTFWACILGGMIPVPVAAPTTPDIALKIFRIREILGTPGLIASTGVQDKIVALTGMARERLLCPPAGGEGTPIGRSHPVSADDAAFIQFSSGSTGEPKGVVLTHANLLANIRSIAGAAKITGADRLVSWMPLTHDFGIIWFQILPIVLGLDHALIATNTFLRNPLVWLRSAGTLRSTVTGAPNFAYRHVLKHLRRDMAGDWRLDSLRFILNGAEPISVELARRFENELAPYGLRRGVITAGYGLAEATLAVTIANQSEGLKEIGVDRRSLSIGDKVRLLPDSSAAERACFAEVGPPVTGVTLRVMGDSDIALGDAMVGRIEIRGPNVTPGYCRNEAATRSVLKPDGWLDTGDLGFVMDGKLYITGRRKDVVIINGANYYPPDIERAVSSVAGIDINMVVAAGVPQPEREGECLAIFILFRRPLTEFAALAREVRDAVVREIGISAEYCVPVAHMPRTTSGKLQRFRLVEAFRSGEFTGVIEELAGLERGEFQDLHDAWQSRETRRFLSVLTAEASRLVPSSALTPDAPLLQSGMTSLRLVELTNRLNMALDLSLSPTFLFDHSSLRDIANALMEETPRTESRSRVESADPVAIIGVSCRLPKGINDPEAFWTLLDQGDDAIGPRPRGRSPEGSVIAPLAGWLNEIRMFDHRLFQISPAEAEALDPQQSLLLVTSWNALEDAGIDPHSLRGSATGVFTGITNFDQLRAQSRAGADAMTGPFSVTGTSPSVASGRISFVYGFLGPNLALDTACSSGLAAVHQAIRSLNSGECDLALASAVNLILSDDVHLGLRAMNALSPDGRCKPFDAAADGYGRGEGCIVLVLKRLSDAKKDGNRVLGLIRGSAMNHDGRSSALTAPNGIAQQHLLRQALVSAGADPADIDYVEAHGTGTPLGDPIEAGAVTAVYCQNRSAGTPLIIGSVKSNIGHLESAAGLAGILKVLLALEHNRIPRTLHVTEPNPRIAWSELPLQIATQPVEWPSKPERPRRAGVSAFGFSGTNVHVIIEEAPSAARDDIAHERRMLVPVSACSDEALIATAKSVATAIRISDPSLLHDLVHTLGAGRAQLPFRIVASGCTAASLADDIDAAISVCLSAAKEAPKIVFGFPGQGSQLAAVATGLLGSKPRFRETLERADAIVAPVLGRSLISALTDSGHATALAQTELTQPLVIAMGLALAAIMEQWGIKPDLVVGHSVGEIAAAIYSGAISFESGLRFAAERGKLMARLPSGGAMAAVFADESRIAEFIGKDLSIAAVNAPDQITVSGNASALDAFEERAKEAGIRAVRLPVSHAFHSHLIEPVLTDLRRVAAGLEPGVPRFAAHSSLTGAKAHPVDFLDPGHWVAHARQPVLFEAAIRSMMLGPGACFVELGARRSLAPLVAAIEPGIVALPRSNEDLADAMLDSAGALFAAGAELDWGAISPGRTVRGPGYQFVEQIVPAKPAFSPGKPNATEPSDRPYTIADSAEPVSHAGPSRHERISSRIRALVCAISGLSADRITGNLNWFALGLDSLLLVQIQQSVNREYGLTLGIADIIKEGESLDALAALVDRTLPPDSPQPESAKPGAAPNSEISTLMAQQTEAMSRLFAEQLATLRQLGLAVTQETAKMPIVETPPIHRAVEPASRTAAVEIKGLFRQMPARQTDWTPEQELHFGELAHDYNARTRASKDDAQRHRPHLANPRAIIGFRPEWKETTYPLTVARAEGAHVFDVDGHRYIDITMGFGAILLGHTPPCVASALAEEISRGAPLGPQSPKQGLLAAEIAAMTGVERAAFFTTGSEAVMVAVRLARSVTGRRKTVLFTGAYHGTFDAVLAAGWADGDKLVSMPITDGTPQSIVDDTVVLRYGDSASLDRIRSHANEIAAVLVEPVQSRNPGLQPKDFLHALRRLTAESGIALIFDEIILGFRVHPGGAQAHFGIEADIVTYGKVVGGGLPIGVVAGKRRFLDAVDGGMWSYGDSSLPSARTAFVAGTFGGHALSMAAGLAVLQQLRASGPDLQAGLNRRTAEFCAELDGFFAAENVPIRMSYFSSLFRFDFSPGTELLNVHLLKNGVFVWEGRNCFLSTAHTDSDLAGIMAAVRQGVADMRRGAMLPAPEQPIPLTQVQREIFFLSQARPESGQAYHEAVALQISGALDRKRLGAALARVVERHPVLRMAHVDGESWRAVAAAPPLPDPIDIGPNQESLEPALAKLIDEKFDLESGPPIRVALLRRQAGIHVLALIVHHIAVDGWSLGLILGELAQLYQEPSANLPELASFKDFVSWAAKLTPSTRSHEFLPPPAIPVFGNPEEAGRGTRIHRRAVGFEDLKHFARSQGVSQVAAMLAAFTAFIHRLSGQERFTVGMPYAGHAAAGMTNMAGQASAVMPVPVEIVPELTFSAHVQRTSKSLLAALEQASELMRPLSNARPEINVLFNMDRGVSLRFGELPVELVATPIARAKYKLFLNLLEFNGSAFFDFDIDRSVADPILADRLLNGFEHLLGAAIADASTRLANLPMPVLGEARQPKVATKARHIEPPRNAREARLAVIWAGILKLPEVGVTESFFELGGHSLAGLAILAGIERETGKRVSIRQFFEGPTIRELARAIDGSAEIRQPLTRVADAADYAPSHGQARLWMLDQMRPGLTAYNVGFGLWSRRRFDSAVLRRALLAVAERHETLRTALVDRDGLPRQKIAASIEPRFAEMHTTTEHDTIAAARRLVAEPFDLAEAPLWRAALLHADGRDCIVIVLHHAICDVWSVGLFIRDLVTALRGESLQPLAVQYRDVAIPSESASTKYWKNILTPLPPRTELASDFTRPPVKTYAGASVTQRIDAARSADLRALAASQGTSLFVLMASAIDLLLYSRTGNTDIVIGTVVAGRGAAQLDDQIGFFVNTLPLRNRIDPEITFGNLLANMRQRILEAFEYELTPFDRIVESAGVARDNTRNPLFEIVLVMDDRREIRSAAAPLELEPFEIEGDTSQFDFTLYVTDDPDAITLNAVYNTDLFKAETISNLITDLSALLEYALDRPHAKISELAKIHAADLTRTPEPHQERLWFVDRFERGILYPSGPTYYNMPLAVEVAAGFDRKALGAALARMPQRHAELRTAFVPESELPEIRIAGRTIAVPVKEIPAGADAFQAVIAESLHPFDLSIAPLCRAVLAIRQDGTALLALVAHHAIADPVTLERILGDLQLLWQNPAAPAPALHEPVTAQKDSAEDRIFWKTTLTGAPPLVLLTDRPRPAIHRYEMGRLEFKIPDAGTGLSRAAFLALLHRLSGQDDIVHGEPLYRADSPANLLVLRSAVSGEQNLLKLALSGNSTRDLAEQHGELPFDQAVLAVKPPNDMSRTALFDVLFDPGTSLCGKRFVEFGLGWGKYDLVLSLRRTEVGVSASLVYNRLLFDDESARRFSVLYQRLLTSDSSIPVDEIDLCGDEGRASLRKAFLPPHYPHALTLTRAFAEMAARRGNATAITDGNRTVSYSSLDRAANALAARLTRAGIRRGDRVGVLLDRSSELIAAFLGILKCGAAYVPIDPALPRTRIDFIISDARLAAVCCAGGSDFGVTAIPAVPVDALAAEAAPPIDAAQPDDVAYVIYTSGSTGKPKGVEVEHRNVVQLMFQDLPIRFSDTDVWSMFHSPGFDFSVWEMYGALLFGGRLVIVARDQAADTASFAEIIAAERVTVLNQTPAAFQAVCDSIPRDSALRVVIFGGAALQPAALAGWRVDHPSVRLINMYGITETTVHVTWIDIGEDEIARGQPVIGRPLPNYRIILVDSRLRPVPDGVPGEICVAGPGVARGYLDRPELTAERFVSLPDFPGQRLYRSGDLAWRRGDGNLVYLGRNDDQVKIRGFRIEPGEVERQLMSLPGVKQAVVLPDAAHQSLTAWLVGSGGDLDTALILRQLSDKLPAYMIPQHYFEIASIPLTGNGKLDRGALLSAPARALTAARGGRLSDGPERIAAAVWREILGIEPGPDDNFFLLGGHSLQANQAVVRLRRATGCALSLKEFFAAPNLAALAALLSARMGEGGTGGETIPRVAAKPGELHPLSSSQRRLWLLQMRNPDSVAYNMVGAIRIVGTFDKQKLAEVFAVLIQRHEILRSCFVERAGEPYQIVDNPPDEFPLMTTVVPHSRLEETTNSAIDTELRHVFDLARGPLLRVQLIESAENNGTGTWIMVLNIHHIISDGWSVNIMLRELSELMRGEIPGKVEIQYKDYAAWQNRLIAEGALSAQQNYWIGRFDEMPASIDLPDSSRQASGRGAIVRASLSTAATAALQSRARFADCSLFMLLVSLVECQLHGMSGQDEVVIGTPVAGRNHIDLETQIGCYLNLLPLRICRAGLSHFSELLAEVRTTALDAFANQDYPFDLLVDELQIRPLAGRSPLFDVLIILQNQAPPRLEIQNARTEVLRDVTVSSKYHLNYMFEQHDGLEFMLEYSTDLFDSETAQRIADQFVRFAEIAATESDPPLSGFADSGDTAAIATGEVGSGDGW